MTITGWFIFGLLSIIIIGGVICVVLTADGTIPTVISIIVGIILILLILFGLFWYYKNTADGQRAMVDQRSNFKNGLERTITVYTAIFIKALFEHYYNETDAAYITKKTGESQEINI